MKPARLRAALLATLLLGGCTTVGRDYVVPDQAKVRLPAARRAFANADGAAVNPDPVPDNWWRLFDDPALDRLERDALSANADLRVAAANLARAEAVESEADTAGRPRLQASAAAARSQLSAESYLLPTRLPQMNLADAGAAVSYQIDLFGKLRRAAEAAKADAEATSAALDVARVSVVADVARAYVAACSAGYELAAAKHALDVQEQSLAATERLAAAGRGTPIDTARGRSLVDQSRAAIPAFEARRRAALYKLAVLTGEPPAAFPPVVATCSALPRVSQPIPVGDGASLLRRRPDIRQAERMLAAATARIGVATAALYPSIGIGLGGGSTGLLTDLGEPAANYWSVGALISWSMPDGRERARIMQADAVAAAALARFDGIVLNALRETETSLAAYTQDLRRNAELRAARDEAAEAQQQIERLYRAGRSPYLTALDSRRTLAAAEAALAASESQISDDQVTLFLVLGGGWAAKAG